MEWPSSLVGACETQTGLPVAAVTAGSRGDRYQEQRSNHRSLKSRSWAQCHLAPAWPGYPHLNDYSGHGQATPAEPNVGATIVIKYTVLYTWL